MKDETVIISINTRVTVINEKSRFFAIPGKVCGFGKTSQMWEVEFDVPHGTESSYFMTHELKPINRHEND